MPFPGNASETVVAAIRNAEHSVHLAAYSFTSKHHRPGPGQVRSRRGVEIAAVLDKSNATARYSAATFLTHAGIATRIDRRYAIMHNKFMVIDGVTVETGSFNFTQAAERSNAENVIVLGAIPRSRPATRPSSRGCGTKARHTRRARHRDVPLLLIGVRARQFVQLPLAIGFGQGQRANFSHRHVAVCVIEPSKTH